MKNALLIIILIISSIESIAQNCYTSMSNKELIVLIEEDYNNLINNVTGFDTTDFALLSEQGIELWKLGFTEASLIYFDKFCTKNKIYKRESYKDFPILKYYTLFGQNSKSAKYFLSDLSYKIALLGYNESMLIKNYESAKSFISFTIYFTPFKIKECRSYLKQTELDIAEEQYEQNVYKLMKYHWTKLSQDSSRIKRHKFIGFEHLLKQIDNKFTKQSYAEFLDKLIEDSFIRSTDQYSSILESKIKNLKVYFYNKELSCRFSHPNVCCDTIIGYFHEEPHPWAANMKIECDTITNSLNPNLDFEQYRSVARSSTLFWIRNQLKD